jgi:hypothetical protein
VKTTVERKLIGVFCSGVSFPARQRLCERVVIAAYLGPPGVRE